MTQLKRIGIYDAFTFRQYLRADYLHPKHNVAVHWS